MIAFRSHSNWRSSMRFIRLQNLAFAAALWTVTTLFFACEMPIYAQGIITGGIIGTVVDPTGAIIPGALAKVVSESTGTSFLVKTNDE